MRRTNPQLSKSTTLSLKVYWYTGEGTWLFSVWLTMMEHTWNTQAMCKSTRRTKMNKTSFETVKTVSSPVFVNKTNTNKLVVPVHTVFWMIIKAGLEVIFMNTMHLSSVMKCQEVYKLALTACFSPRDNAQSSDEHSKHSSDLLSNCDFKGLSHTWVVKNFHSSSNSMRIKLRLSTWHMRTYKWRHLIHR